jgi:hypothetical protein
MHVATSEFLTQSALARRLDRCPATVTRLIRNNILRPDAIVNGKPAFRADRLDQLKLIVSRKPEALSL